MKLILMTTPHFFVEEHQILSALFEEGLDILHLRKPNTEPIFSERLLQLIPDTFRKNIVTHDHFYLKNEYGLHGIHLNERNPELPNNYKGHKSITCHNAEELCSNKGIYDYVFLSPIYDGISDPTQISQFSSKDLSEMAKQKLLGKNVIAKGGVELENIPYLMDLGFGGVVISGSLWSKFNIHQTSDFKEVIAYFRKLKKSVSHS